MAQKAPVKVISSDKDKATMLFVCTPDGKPLLEIGRWPWKVHGAQGAYTKAYSVVRTLSESS